MNQPVLRRFSFAVFIVMMLSVSSRFYATGKAVFNVKDYGATGRKADDARPAVQKAIDACAAAGGGAVYLPPGEYTSGTLYLRSHVYFHIEAGATLFASQDVKGFDRKNPNHSALLYGEDIENITIEGRGTIDGQAEYDWREDDHEQGFSHKRLMLSLDKPLMRTFPKDFPKRALYPFLVWLKRCKDVRIAGLSLLHSPSWTIALYASERVVIDGIYAYTSLKEAVWADGIDLDGCKDVHISNSTIETGDDCIIFISSNVWGPALPCENITITNCRLSSASAAIKFSEGNWLAIRKVVVDNTIITNANRGFVFSVTEGGTVSDVVLCNLIIDCNRFDWFWAGDGEPFYFRITRKSEWNGQPPTADEPPPGSIRNVMIRNVIARGKGSSIINGHPDSWLDGISLENIKLFLSTDLAAPYDVAVHAIKCRWAQSLKIKDLEVAWGKPALDKWGSALYFEDVNGLQLDGFIGRQAWSDRDAPTVVLNNVADATIRNSRALDDTKIFLKVLGKGSRGICLEGNDFRKAQVPYQLDNDITSEAVVSFDNLQPSR
jgi:glycosyl hydrolase family 28/pectate lyase-like protein